MAARLPVVLVNGELQVLQAGDTLARPATYVGSGVPDNAVGSNGDLYIDTVQGDIYYKLAAGTWVFKAGNAHYLQGKSLDASTIAPANGNILVYDSSLAAGVGAWKVASNSIVDLDYVLIQDQKTQGTNGGTATNSSWLKRNLNTIVADTGSNVTSLSSDEFVLKAGTYRVCISVPALECQRHQARLYNVTDSAVLLLGTSEFSQTTNASGTRSFIVGRITLAAAKTLRVEHIFSAATANTYVRGEAGNFTTEIYTQVELIKESASFGGLDDETRARLNLAIL
jgi:hypothetical protein